MTLIEKVRYMLFNTGLPKSFWVEAVSTVCFLGNHLLSRAIDKKESKKGMVWQFS